MNRSRITIVELGLVRWGTVDEIAVYISYEDEEHVEATIRYEISRAWRDARADARDRDLRFSLSDALGMKLAIRERIWAQVRRLRKEREYTV